MPLALYNTLTRRKEVFEPLDPNNVRMYVCGPTVYDFAHIGNARPVIAFDVLFRLLRSGYGENHVTYVRNITDVDDKINAAASANGETIRALTERTAQAFHEDVAALRCLEPSREPRATEHIPQMIAMIGRLVATGHAYEKDGHVLFAVGGMADYGKLSKKNRDELIAGARVEVAPYKRDPADFVLWKPSPPELPGWDSPWGRGRPGWHIECSAMSETYLGQSFDIHGGGLDLIFPHHENEIAQSECAHGGKPLSRFWMHNGFVTVEGEKMSKSLGNFRTIRDALADAPGEAVRYAMLKTHYRQPLNWTAEGLKEAKAELDKLYRTLGAVAAFEQPELKPVDNPAIAALEDDLNTPLALTALHDLAGELRIAGDPVRRSKLKRALREAGDVLGIFQSDPQEWFRWQPKGAGGIGDAEIEALIAQRLAARKTRDFARADQIRRDLAARGVVLEDKPDGATLWRRGG